MPHPIGSALPGAPDQAGILALTNQAGFPAAKSVGIRPWSPSVTDHAVAKPATSERSLITK